jgi:GMP synthase-like glutamine amidotransferase
MRIHIFQHASYEGLGTIREWADARSHDLSFTRWFAGEVAPTPGEWDLLVVMGGPMNIYEEAEFPWLRAEKACLDAILAEDRPVLGVCLGAQLLADRLGGFVGRNAWSEIGWQTLELTRAGAADPVFSALPERLEAFHWHGDTFAIPPGATHAAFTEACAAQAFRKGRCVGLQCHLELDPDSLQGLIAHTESFEGLYVQKPRDFLARSEDFEALRRANFSLLDRFEAFIR